MNTMLKKTGILSLLSLVVAACGGGGTDVAGIGGTGYIATGTITGFGSVYVNGVKYETDTASFEVEDNTLATQGDLGLGMVVTVNGTINADGVTGTATSIRYEDVLEGPIATGSIVSVDSRNKTFTVLNTNVQITDGVTVFEGGSSFASIAEDDVIEISGYFDNNVVLRATRIEGKSPSSNVEIKGVVTVYDSINKTFTINGVNVNAFNAISLPSGGISNGLYVEVKGAYDSGSNLINATDVEAEDNSFGDEGDEVSIEGYITRYAADNDFDINGFPVDASGATRIPASLVLAEGMQIEVEGSITGGALVATEIELEDGEAEVHAPIVSINLATDSFTVQVQTGGFVSVITDSATEFEDDVSSVEPFSLALLTDTDFVEVSGLEDSNNPGTIIASYVKRSVPEDIVLQGEVTAQSTDITVSVLGIDFPVDSATSYQDSDDNILADHAAFIAKIGSSRSIVKIVDKADTSNNPVGIADEVELEAYLSPQP